MQVRWPVYTSLYRFIQVSLYEYIHVCVYIMYVYIYTCMYRHLCTHIRVHIIVCTCIHIEVRISIVVELANSWSQCNVYSPLQGSSGTLDCVLTCLSKPSHERTEDDIEGLLDVLVMLPVSV